MSQPPLINVHRIAKSFSGHRLFDEVSFGVGAGERIGLVGPNGAGKSTLFKILARTVDADGGTVAWRKGLRVALVEQTPEFGQGATVLQSVLEKAPKDSSGHSEVLGKALEIMAHLGLNSLGDMTSVDQLSGGWKKRLALARELVLEPELLLLDEPTNHLDITGILWLERFLIAAPFTFVMITHDRLFLSRVTNRILDLDPRNPHQLLDVRAGYTSYLEAKQMEMDTSRRQEWVQKNKLRQEKEWLARGSIARQTKQSARKQSAADLEENVDLLRDRNRSRQVDLAFGEAGHSPKKLIEAQGLQKAYSGRTLFENLDLLITPKTRITLLGDNGTGKSTLIKILLGTEPADQGSVKRADLLQVAYFEQTRDALNPSLSVLKNLCPEGDFVVCQGQSMHVRSYLDRFQFAGIKVELPVEKLSGGERARLRLAQLMLSTAQVLVLDEPTNDLDGETLETLESSLRDFQGAVIIVTHDRYFMDAVADQILAFPVMPSGRRELQKFSSYFQWESWYESEISQSVRKKQEAGTATTSASSPKGRMSFRDKFELENMEKSILDLEQKIAELTTASQAPEFIANHVKLAEIHSQLAASQSELERKYERWNELEKKR